MVDDEFAALCARARVAARKLAPHPRAVKDEALKALAKRLRASKDDILAANARDMARAESKGVSPAMLDRLALDDRRIASMADGVAQIADLDDPVGETIAEQTRPSGIKITRVRVPIGVIAMIYEARPNVTAEASALCLKAGNAVVLRGGTEASASNAAIAKCVTEALDDARLPRDAAQLITIADRDAVRALVQQTETVDLVIPRGGEGLIRTVTEQSRVPVVQHYKGVCHLYLDEGCDADMAKKLVVDGKLSRPGVCNALECLLVNEKDAKRLLEPIGAALAQGSCEVHGDEKTRAILPDVKAATADDWGKEFLDRVIAIRVVENLDEAMAHVARFGSGHTEAICTKNQAHADRWRREVDAACVVVNASTRFHDGGQFGLGAEIGIATSRLHWRGPMGLESLTTMKWVVDGEGQVRG
ncbi:MAG TPA: glutamate-5-semialdehyde dehydrogenase [Polyangiaceae bacterium]